MKNSDDVARAEFLTEEEELKCMYLRLKEMAARLIEIEEMYPSFINQAIKDGRMDAKKSFEIALEREKHHRDVFRDAIKKLEETKGD